LTRHAAFEHIQVELPADENERAEHEGACRSGTHRKFERIEERFRRARGIDSHERRSLPVFFSKNPVWRSVRALACRPEAMSG